MPYDVFISYARRDNTDGRVSELVERIADDYRQLSAQGTPLLFRRARYPRHGRLAVHDPRGPEGVAALPARPLARVPEEQELRVGDRRVPQVRIGPRGERRGRRADLRRDDPRPGRARVRGAGGRWFARVRRRQRFDLRAWFDAGRQALESHDVRTRIDDLKSSFHTRLSRLQRIASVPGNLPAHNPRFVGRETEMCRLHEAAGLGQLGVISARAWHRRAGQDGPGHPVRLRLRRLLPRRPLARRCLQAGPTWPRRFAPSTSTSESSSPTRRSSTTPARRSASCRTCTSGPSAEPRSGPASRTRPAPHAPDPGQHRRRPAAPASPHRPPLRQLLAARACHDAAGSRAAQPRRRSPPPSARRRAARGRRLATDRQLPAPGPVRQR